MYRDRLLNVCLVLLAICAIITTAITVDRFYFSKPLFAKSDANIVEVDDWKSYGLVGNRYGSDNAKVTIVEFTDFGCPFCKKMLSPLRESIAPYLDEIVVVYRHFPLGLAEYGTLAANVSECGASQNKFEEIREVLFENRALVDSQKWDSIAFLSNISDRDDFTNCIFDSRYKERIDRDIEAGKRLGVQGTPTYLINNKKVTGAITKEQLSELITDALKSQ